jgi:hypothetical protein
MKSVEFKNSIDSKRKVLMSLYWVNKKVAVMEGCAPFYIEKIITESTVYLSTDDSSIKLSQVLLKDILKNIEADKKVKFKINMGEECIDTFIHKNVFSISTTKNKDLEMDIAEKLRLESEKKHPNVCSKFKTRVGIS